MALLFINCSPLCCALAGWWDRRVLGKVHEDLVLPIQQGPPLGCTGLFQRNAKHYIWSQFGCRSCRKDVVVGESTALGAPLLLFPQGLIPKPYSLLSICKVAEDWNQGLPSPRRAAVPGWQVPFTRSSWFRGACDPPPPLLLSVVAVPLGLETKGQSHFHHQEGSRTAVPVFWDSTDCVHTTAHAWMLI